MLVRQHRDIAFALFHSSTNEVELWQLDILGRFKIKSRHSFQPEICRQRLWLSFTTPPHESPEGGDAADDEVGVILHIGIRRAIRFSTKATLTAPTDVHEYVVEAAGRRPNRVDIFEWGSDVLCLCGGGDDRVSVLRLDLTSSSWVQMVCVPLVGRFLGAFTIGDRVFISHLADVHVSDQGGYAYGRVACLDLETGSPDEVYGVKLAISQKSLDVLYMDDDIPSLNFTTFTFQNVPRFIFE